MKKIIVLFTAIFISSSIVNAEEKKTLADLVGGDCLAKHKVSPDALGCSVKKMFRKKDGSPNIFRKIFNAKSFADLKK